MNDLNKLLEKYWNGETSLEEEKIIKKHFKEESAGKDIDNLGALFAFFEKEKNIKYNGDLLKSKPVVKESKVIKMAFIRKIAVAASILLVLSVGTYVGNSYLTKNNTSYAKNEIKDPEKARKIAEDALAILASNYVKGEESMTKSIESFEKINIINSLIKSN